MKRMRKYLLIPLSAAMVACGQHVWYDLSGYSDTAIYYGGDIVTVDDGRPEAEAVLVGDGRIVAVGGKRELMRSRRPDTKLGDLKGMTMLPGFIDSHSHISSVTKFPDFSPAEGVTSVETLVEYGRREFDAWYDRSVAEGTYEPGDWFIGNGYDNTVFPGAEGPTADDLDRISEEVPVCIIHMSNHVAVVNNRALELMGYSPGSPLVREYAALLGRYPDGRLNGLLEEEAYFRLYYDPNVLMDNAVTNAPSEEDVLRHAMRVYASHGITTAQDGAGSNIAASVRTIVEQGDSLIIDINSYGDLGSMSVPSREAVYRDGLRRAGVKLFLDGSPQAKTAWLLEPYYVVPAGKGADYDGFPQMTDDELYSQLAECLRKGYQVIAHTNGSAAIGQFLDQYARAKLVTAAEEGMKPVLIHAQTITEEQLDRAEELGVDVSFFNDHTYYWGDYYLTSILGPELGRRISPLRTALERKGLNITIHQDSPVVPPDMLFSIYNAVNRITRSGQPIGPEYAVTPMEALRMVTVNGARQYGQEDDRGSITPGKIADFVILDRNPLKVPGTEIKDIAVVRTVKRGRVIYPAGGAD